MPVRYFWVKLSICYIPIIDIFTRVLFSADILMPSASIRTFMSASISPHPAPALLGMSCVISNIYNTHPSLLSDGLGVCKYFWISLVERWLGLCSTVDICELHISCLLYPRTHNFDSRHLLVAGTILHALSRQYSTCVCCAFIDVTTCAFFSFHAIHYSWKFLLPSMCHLALSFGFALPIDLIIRSSWVVGLLSVYLVV